MQPFEPLSEPGPSEDLQDLYDNAPCGYVSLTPDGHIVKITATLLGWLGYSSQDLMDRHVHDFLSFGGKLAFETHLAPLLRLQGFVHEIALDLVDASGEKLPVIANSAERRGAAGEHLFTRMIVFRAVDRRMFERNLMDAKAKAEALAQEEHEATMLREQFIAVLGHDLRNPLAALKAGTGLLRRPSLDDAMRGRVLEEMEASIARANGLISDVMDFARGKLGSGLPVDLLDGAPVREALEQVVMEQRRISDDKTIEVALDLTHPIRCDSRRIAQLAANLLANAVSHGSANQSIRLSASTTPDSFELCVSNSGEPIPEDAQNHLFEPFFRADFSAREKGLGLGLFIVNEIASAHGGSMKVTSDAQETCFTFAMPRATSD